MILINGKSIGYVYGLVAGYKSCCAEAFVKVHHSKRTNEQRLASAAFEAHWKPVFCHECAIKYISGEYTKISDVLDIDTRNRSVSFQCRFSDIYVRRFINKVKRIDEDSDLPIYNEEIALEELAERARDKAEQKAERMAKILANAETNT